MNKDEISEKILKMLDEKTIDDLIKVLESDEEPKELEDNS